ncbi:MAG: hypothetical protein QOG21_599 [Actinomycetota bacterium]|nr:hypothetical protein [Actinomycetota bacterium]
MGTLEPELTKSRDGGSAVESLAAFLAPFSRDCRDTREEATLRRLALRLGRSKAHG